MPHHIALHIRLDKTVHCKMTPLAAGSAEAARSWHRRHEAEAGFGACAAEAGRHRDHLLAGQRRVPNK